MNSGSLPTQKLVHLLVHYLRKWPEPIVRELYDPEQVELTLFLGSKTENEPTNEPINADILSIYELIKAEPTIS